MKKKKIQGITHNAFFTQEREMDRYFETEQELGTNQKLFEVTGAHDDVIVLNVLRRKWQALMGEITNDRIYFWVL